MPTCRHCQRRVWFWQVGLFGGSCALCRAEKKAARMELAKERKQARRMEFEQSSTLRRGWLGARRGAVIGTVGLVFVGMSTFAALFGESGGDQPLKGVPLRWALIVLGAVIVAGLIGWWLSSWWVALLCLVGFGAIGGAVIGGYRGLRGRWELFDSP